MVINSPVIVGRILAASFTASRGFRTVIAVHGTFSGEGIREGRTGGRQPERLSPALGYYIELVVAATFLIDGVRVEIGIGADAELAEYGSGHRDAYVVHSH